MKELKPIPAPDKKLREATPATPTIGVKIFGAETFEELYDVLKLVDVLYGVDGKEYHCDDLKKEIERAREQLRTFNVAEREIVLTQEGFEKSYAYPLRNIPEISGLKDKVSLLLRKEK